MILILEILFFAFVCIVFLGVVIVNRRRNRFSAKDLHYINSNWYRILDSFEHSPKEVLLEADKLLHFCLKKKGGKRFNRLSLGEMLKVSDKFFVDIDGVWFAHKLRNKIAHEIGFKVSSADAKKALFSYKKALVELGVKI